MLVKSQLKLIRSLQQKKYRNQHGLFFVEGKKTVEELLASNLKPYKVYCLDFETFDVPEVILVQVTIAELKQISCLKNPPGILGVFYIPKEAAIDLSDWMVALDDVSDPGNLGTIIRLCDWFGIKHIICSKNTVDCYNPKVLQATMGSIARVHLHYIDLNNFLQDAKVPVYGAFMDRASVYNTNLPKKGILVMGNEANGISKEVSALISQEISIPQFGNTTTESLNVATATAILLNEVRRG
jgi:TrmH family RNA methyltransferase